MVGRWVSNTSALTFEFFANGMFAIDDPSHEQLTGIYHVRDRGEQLAHAEFILRGSYDIRFTPQGKGPRSIKSTLAGNRLNDGTTSHTYDVLHRMTSGGVSATFNGAAPGSLRFSASLPLRVLASLSPRLCASTKESAAYSIG